MLAWQACYMEATSPHPMQAASLPIGRIYRSCWVIDKISKLISRRNKMESGNAVIGALIFIVLIIGANFVMYGIARGWAKNGDSQWMSALKKGLSKPLESQANKSMEELRQKMEELQKSTKKDE